MSAPVRPYPPGSSRPGRTLIGAAATLLLLATPACSRRLADPADTVSEHAIVVDLRGPTGERTADGGCVIDPPGLPDGPFTVDATFFLENDAGVRLNSTQMPSGAMDAERNCRVTLSFLFVDPDSSTYRLRTNLGTGWWLSNAEAFAHPTTVIDVVAHPPA
ncbi:hypothetical protein FDO65_16140 [Nakamurella flava]|uniref:Lipoprotein n=1 Tax=Nakamurella flava TaxID=2576308 RepID=A0A4U6QCE3_9ACTN|nr:hypothetical protein [Nakamurella flava]TKV57681.1 hypothetical protein FDO65_16140 [Nakamurella flava]